MVQPYLKQPNYIGAMQAGLGSKLNYIKARGRGGSSRGRSSGGEETSYKEIRAINGPGAPGSPERRAWERNKGQVEKVNELKIEKAGVDLKSSKANVKAKIHENTKKDLQLLSRFAPNLSIDNYEKFYELVDTNQNIPNSMFKTPQEYYDQTPDERSTYNKQIYSLGTPSDEIVKHSMRIKGIENRSLQAENKALIKEQKRMEKEQKKKEKLLPKASDVRADKKTLLTIEKEMSKVDKDGNISTFLIDKDAGSSHVNQYNNLSPNDMYIWKEEVHEVPVDRKDRSGAIGNIMDFIVGAKDWVAGTPTEMVGGYVKVPKREVGEKVSKRRQITDPEEIEATLAEAYKLIREGYNADKIIQRLNEYGIEFK